MLRLVRFPSPSILRRRVALALTVIAAVACADRVTAPDRAATDRAAKDIIPPTNPFDDLWVSPRRAVNAGEAAWGTIHMKQPAPAGGAHIVIHSTNPKVASLDSNLFIPEGAVSQDFLVQTYSTPVNIGIQVYADWGQWRVTGGFTVFHVPAPPVISVTPASLTFGPQAIGTTSAAQVVTVRNNGTESALTLGVITISGPFTQTNNCPATLAPNAYCTISVRYAPTGAGAQSGSLTIPSNAGNVVVSLNGTGFVPTPALSLTPGAISWGGVPLGTITSGRVVKITSNGNVPLVVSSLNLAGLNPDDFYISNDGCSGATLAPGSSCTAYVSFEPTRLGGRSATVVIAHNAAGGTSSVALTGTGVKPAGGWTP